MSDHLDRLRLAHLLGMLGSHHDGEVLNAARLADRHVRDRKLTWQSVLMDCVEAGREVGLHEVGLAQGRCESRVYGELPPHQVLVMRCLELGDLSAKERDFLLSLRRWRQLTPKQEKWLRDIYRRWQWREQDD